MPLISYLCSCKKNKSKFFRSIKEAPSILVCECGLDMKKQLSAPNTSSVITIDNGLMAKSLDINLEVICSNEKDSLKNFSE